MQGMTSPPGEATSYGVEGPSGPNDEATKEREHRSERGKRGNLRIYFGVAPGVGKTFAMLNEGWRKAERGGDVVVGYFEDHGRPQTTEQLRDLEIIPLRRIEYRGQTFEEMDVDAVLARRPEVALVDELAHTNVPGFRNHKRWQDIEELLDAGIDVVSTVNVQHLESLNDVVERITGVRQQETVPDAVVRSADQIELVDMSPEALRRRMAHGNIYPADKVDAALGNYFRLGNLTALRELALLWVADRVDEALGEYRERHGIQEIWDTREKVVVALTSAEGEDEVIRRAARSATRNRAKLIGIHVRRDDGLRTKDDEHLNRYIELLKEFGGTYREVSGSNVARSLVQAARTENATQLFLGESDRSRWSDIMHGSVVNATVRYSGSGLDVHVISTQTSEVRRHRSLRFPGLNMAPLPARRRATAFGLVVFGLPLLTTLLTGWRESLDLQNSLLIYLLFAVAVGAIGGVWPAIIGTVTAFFLVDYYFVIPIHHFSVTQSRDVIAMIVFVAISAIVSTLTDVSARRTADGRRARHEAQGLARMAASMLSEHDPLPELMADLVVTFRLDGVALLVPTAGGWYAEATAGASPPTSPVGQGAISIALSPSANLVVLGSNLSGEDQEVLRVFGNHLAVALETRRLQREAEGAAALAKSNELRTALLSAVSHDLRTPLASIKAAATSLLSPSAHWEDPHAQRSLLKMIDSESDRLNAMVADLLDMSRIRTGVLVVHARPTSVEEVFASLLDAIGGPPGRVELHLVDHVPLLRVDPSLLQRVLVNLVENALHFSAPGEHVHLAAAPVLDRVHIRVVDSGPGIPEDERERVFRPFQRQGDVPEGQGVGLGLAIAKGFVEAMDGELDIDETPGGGVTMVVSLPTVSELGISARDISTINTSPEARPMNTSPEARPINTSPEARQ